MSTKTTYKQTELGLIPEDWEVKKLGEIGNIITGSTPSTTNLEYYKNGTFDFIGPADLNSNKYIDNAEKKVTEKGLNVGRILKQKSVLVTCIGSTIGKIGINKNICITNQQINAIETDKNNSDFIYYSILERKGRLKLIAGEQAVPVLNKTEFSKFKIPVPPLPEQKAIADCISTWDSAIEKQSALINALTQRKKALMQQLLTGKKRLPGFSEEWKEMKLGEICEIKKGSQINKIELSSNLGFPVINGGIEPSGYHDDWNVAENTITISEGGNSCGFINFIKEKFWSGGHCYTLQNLKININKIFLFYFLKNSENQIMKLRVGSGLPNIQQKDIKNFEILLPKIEEQTAIAEILATADRELQLQKDKLAQLQIQKKGLMQVLLTGKKRLLN